MKVVFSKPLRLPIIQSSLKEVSAATGLGMKVSLILLPLFIVPGTQQNLLNMGLMGSE